MKAKTIAEQSLELHYHKKGKIEIISTVSVASREDLALAYTPGVATPCLEIQKDVNKSYELTRRWNMCLVVTDGTAVLGLGDIGPEAAMPVMEGKAALFKAFGGVDAFPMCLKTKDVEEIVRTIYLVSGSFGGVNLEDIAAPRCFEIEKKLQEICDIPIFHDDQHGTAIIMLAGLINALKVVNKKKEEVRIIINGAGAAGTAIAKLLLVAGFANIIMCDKFGVIYQGKVEGMDCSKDELAKITNRNNEKGKLQDVLMGADVFIGVSAGNVLTTEMVKTMASKAIVFACANPTPEILPEQAKAGGAFIVATGRSDYPNQINNVLVFPGIFRGAFDVRAKEINEKMKLAAAYALANLIPDAELNPENIIPTAFNKQVSLAVSSAVSQAALETGVNRTMKNVK
ncbi:MAG: NADP-dependent malic enzyme [Bacilli bacterium]|nr:NADP-dependent malic enzyme [Bacilli bacterium]